MLIRKKIAIILVAASVIPIITLIRIYSNFPLELDANSSSDTAGGMGSIVDISAQRPVADSLSAQKVSNALPPEMRDVDKMISTIERDLAKSGQSNLTQDIKRADALIVEMDELLLVAELGHVELHEEDFIATTKDIDALQAQIFEIDTNADIE